MLKNNNWEYNKHT